MKTEAKGVSLCHWIAIILVLSTAGIYLLLSSAQSSFSSCWNYGSSSNRAPTTSTTLDNVVFGITASSNVWETRKEYIKTWCKPESTRGFVWLDKMVIAEAAGLPHLMMLSEGTNNTQDGATLLELQRPEIRMCRVVSEMFRLGLADVHWFVIGDEDTLFVVENVAKVLAKYDHTEFYYIGGISEAHRQNVLLDDCCSTNMGYGGAGYAISYALAEALEKIQDECIQRYPHLYGCDTRIHACMSELGVPLTREPGFHQFDIVGDPSGILGAHQTAPLLSMHHIDILEPFFPAMTRQRSLEHLFSAARVDPSGMLQQSLCYSIKHSWSIQVSWGYAVQVSRQLIPPHDIENPLRTFAGYGGGGEDDTFELKTRPVPENPCERPVMFYMKTVVLQGKYGSSVSTYNRGPSNGCVEKDALSKLSSITVYKEPTGDSWFQAPTRQCCKIVVSNVQSLKLHVRNCQKGEISAIRP